MSTNTLDKKIVEYLPKLGKAEKKTILEVIKSFMDLKQENQAEIYSEELKEELDNRYEAYKKDGQVVTEEEANKRIDKILSEIN